VSDVKPDRRTQEQSSEKRGDGDGGFWPSDGGERRRRGSRRMLLIGGGVLTVILVAVVAFVFLGGRGAERSAGEAAAASGRSLPSAFVATQSSRDMAKLNARSRDARALTVNEVFPQEVKSVEAEGYQFDLVGSNVASDCSAATWGTDLQTALRKYGCNQIVRGVYASKDAKHASQFAVINLADVNGAHEILRNLDPRAKDGFVKPLTGANVKSFGSGFSAAYVQAAGHYVVLVWVQRLGGANPASMNELVNASLAVQKADEFVWQRLTLVESAARP
jgi:hypothetical protein